MYQPLVRCGGVRGMWSVDVGHKLPLLGSRWSVGIVERAEVFGGPADGFQQFQQSVQFRFVHLHWGGGKQQQAFGALGQLPQQFQVLVGTPATFVGDFREAGAVGLVHNNHVVLPFAAQKFVLVVAQPLVGCNQPVGDPGRVSGLGYAAVRIGQRGAAAGVQQGDADIELALQFFLPLAARRLGSQYQQTGYPPLVEA